MSVWRPMKINDNVNIFILSLASGDGAVAILPPSGQYWHDQVLHCQRCDK